MSTLLNALIQHAWIATLSGIFLLGMIFLTWSKYTKSLLGKDFWVVLPIFGKMAQWRKMTEGTGEHVARMPADAGYAARTLVVPAEMALFNYYDDGLEKISRQAFLNAREYLKISGQNGRRPMSPVVWLILSVLTLAEALGTGLLLAPLLSKDITPEVVMFAGTAIALVIAIVALRFTHAAGEDLFANTLLAKVRSSFRQNKGFRRMDGTTYGDFVRPVGPEDNQDKDVDLEPVGRLAARIGATSMTSLQPRRMNIILASAFVVLFAIATTAYRHYIFVAQQDRSAAAPTTSIGSGSQGFQNMFAAHPSASSPPLPPAIQSQVTKSHDHAAAAIRQDHSMANDAGIMILALIYLFTQLLGFLTGYKYSFFNQDGELAYEKTLGQLGYDDFLRIAVRPVAQRFQLRFGQLRSKLSSANPSYGGHMNPFDFMTAYHESITEDEHHANSGRDGGRATAQSAAPVSSGTAAPSPAPSRSLPGAKPVELVAVDGINLEEVAKEIVAVEGSERRRQVASELIRRHGLNREQQTALAAIIQRLKQEPDIDPGLLDSL